MNSILGSSLRTAVVLVLRLALQITWITLITHLLSPPNYGTLSAVTSFALLLSTLAPLGTNYIVLKASAAGSPSELVSAWRYSWIITSSLGIGLTIAFIFFCELWSPAVIKPTLLAALGLSDIVLVPLIGIFSSIAQGLGRIAVSQLIQMSPTFLRVLAAAFCYFSPSYHSFTSYVFLHALAGCAAFLTSLIYIRTTTFRKLNFKAPDDSSLGFDARYALMSAMAIAPGEVDKLVAARFLSGNELGLYSAATRIVAALAAPINALVLTLQPMLIKAVKERSALPRDVLTRSLFYAFFYGVMCTFFITKASSMISALAGPQYRALTTILCWAAASAPLLYLRVLLGGILVSMSMPLHRATSELIGLIVICVGFVLFVSQNGLLSAAMVLFISELTMVCLELLSVLFVVKKSRQLLLHHRSY